MLLYIHTMHTHACMHMHTWVYIYTRTHIPPFKKKALVDLEVLLILSTNLLMQLKKIQLTLQWQNMYSIYKCSLKKNLERLCKKSVFLQIIQGRGYIYVTVQKISHEWKKERGGREREIRLWEHMCHSVIVHKKKPSWMTKKGSKNKIRVDAATNRKRRATQT